MSKLNLTSGILAAAIILVIFSSGCINNPEQPPESSNVTSDGVQDVVNANNQFALDLYSDLKDGEGNIFFSPYSISTALVMTYEGARGKTGEEMQSVLHFPKDESIRRHAFASIYNEINKKDKKYALSTANALWAQKDYRFLEEYTNNMERYYGGKITNLDFITKTEESRKTINDWVETQTNNKIKDLIPQGALSEMTRLVLTNAIYFKGNWVREFNKSNTVEQDFKVSPDNRVKVQMMSSTGEGSKFNYAETRDVQVLEMPYDGEELSMLVILPKGDDLKPVEKSINAKNIAEWRNMLKKQEVEVYMPRFKFETKYFLAEDLRRMGMPTAFSKDADFSGMDGTKNLFISSVIHQAFVEVNEEGTEAAAATAVIMNLKAVAEPQTPAVFRADHPFIFLIQEKKTGNILFLGRVADPSK